MNLAAIDGTVHNENHDSCCRSLRSHLKLHWSGLRSHRLRNKVLFSRLPARPLSTYRNIATSRAFTHVHLQAPESRMMNRPERRLTMCGSRIALGLALIGVLACGPVQAQQQREQETLGGKDQQFLNYAAEDNQAEIQLCLIAEKRAMDPALKAFARLMVADHVEIESRLAALGNELHASLSDGIGKEGQETQSKLMPLNGKDFENAFMQAQIKDHADDIEKFSDAARSNQNARIKQFATETIPILQQHLALARDVEARLGTHTVGKTPR